MHDRRLLAEATVFGAPEVIIPKLRQRSAGIELGSVIFIVAESNPADRRKLQSRLVPAEAAAQGTPGARLTELGREVQRSPIDRSRGIDMSSAGIDYDRLLGPEPKEDDLGILAVFRGYGGALPRLLAGFVGEDVRLGPIHSRITSTDRFDYGFGLYAIKSDAARALLDLARATGLSSETRREAEDALKALGDLARRLPRLC